jgi:hypothetical protein
MRMNENKSTPGIQSLQQDEAVSRVQKTTYAYKKPGFRRIKPIPINPLPDPPPVLAQHFSSRIY